MMIDMKAAVAANTQSHFKRRANLATANLGAELAVLDLPSGAYLGFNATAAYIWRLLDVPKTLDGLCEATICEFDVGPERCREEVSALLQKLVADGLIERIDGDLA